MLPIVSDCTQQMDCRLIEVQQKAVVRHVQTHVEGCEAPGSLPLPSEAEDSRSRDYNLDENVRAHLRWISPLALPTGDTAVDHPVWAQEELVFTFDVGLDPVEHAFNLDAELRSQEFGQERTLKKMFPDLFRDIGELFG